MVTMIPAPSRTDGLRNLLDNDYFEVAQVGCGGWHGTEKYPADRWKDDYGAGTYEPANPGIKLHYGTNHCYCSQKIANSARLIGKTLTFGVMTDEYGLLLCTGLYTGTTKTDARNSLDTCAIEIIDGSARIIVISGTLTVRWAALYPGAYSEATFPTPTPRGYAAELLECMRYYRPDITVSATKTTGPYYAVGYPIVPYMQRVPTPTLHYFYPYGMATIGDLSGCRVEITKNCIGYVELPTCVEHDAGGLRLSLDADL